MDIKYENVRLSVFVIIMLSFTALIITFNGAYISKFKHQEENQMSNLIELDKMESNIIGNDDILYLYLNDHLDNVIIKRGKIYAQDGSVLTHAIIGPGGEIHVSIHAKVSEVVVNPGGSIYMENRDRFSYTRFINTSGYQIVISEINENTLHEDMNSMILPAHIFVPVEKVANTDESEEKEEQKVEETKE